MIISLQNRAKDIRELMDDPNCNNEMLERTYENFSVINYWLSCWQRVFNRFILPQLSKSSENTLLDIGFGGGDIPEMMQKLANNKGYNLTITAVETDQRALDFVNKMYPDSEVNYLLASDREILESGKNYDFVISNHVIHHLNEKELKTLADTSIQLCNKSILFNDLSRNYLAYYLHFLLTSIAFRNSFIGPDGLKSIRRSYIKSELENVLGEGWKVKSLFPFRLLAMYEK